MTNNACFLTLLNCSCHIILPILFFVVCIVSPFLILCIIYVAWFQQSLFVMFLGILIFSLSYRYLNSEFQSFLKNQLGVVICKFEGDRGFHPQSGETEEDYNLDICDHWYLSTRVVSLRHHIIVK